MRLKFKVSFEKRKNFCALQLEENSNSEVDVAAHGVALGEREVEAKISRGGWGTGGRACKRFGD